jgi:hypothetical protein
MAPAIIAIVAIPSDLRIASSPFEGIVKIGSSHTEGNYTIRFSP